jgi:hypothetical protein
MNELRLRIHIIDPPPNLAYCLQSGKAAQAVNLDYQVSDDGNLTFDLDVSIKQGKLESSTNVTGQFAQGPTTARFFYLAVGYNHQNREPDWFGRIKVPLSSIPWRLALSISTNPDRLVEASFEGTNAQDGAALATVPLLGSGWTPPITERQLSS